MDMFSTTAEAEATRLIGKARLLLDSLERYVGEMKKDMDKRESGAFPVAWSSDLVNQALAIHSEICRGNGATLVRAKTDTP